MKAIKEFQYHVDGNKPSTFEVGADIPEIAQPFALKNGFCEKAKQVPLNKAKSTTQREVKNAK